ncbi:MAG: hypothetical protein D6767_03920 [Candidatus Hydrogenedentota bacterium]|nr:MAG: hypothetical protein D6767_03920 [Candidatus Hydrogenedentota bacterium]
MIVCMLAGLSMLACNRMNSIDLDFSAVGNNFRIVSAETLDLNGNGKIDHYKITFSKAVNDSTFNASNWSIQGYSSIAFSSAVSQDVANDAIIYISFAENPNPCSVSDTSGCDTGMIPDLATTSAGAILDKDLKPLPTSTGVTGIDKAAPVLVAAEGVDSTNQLNLSFSEPVYTGTTGSGNLTASNFSYVNTSGGNAGSITGVIDGDGSDKKVQYSMDVNFAIADETGGDTIGALSSQVYDSAGNAMGTTVKNITLRSNIQAIETMDIDSNGKIDHVKITFYSNVKDNTFPGYAANALGSVTTDWLVAGYNNVKLDTRTASPPSGPGDIANDNILYLAFDEGSNYDTDATPDVTTSTSPGLQVSSSSTQMNPVASGDIIEVDKAAPVMVKAMILGNPTELTLAFSEPVDMDGPPLTANFTTSAFLYNDVSGNDASSIIAISDSDGTDKNVVLVLNTAFTENDDNVDTVAFASSAVFDLAGNTGNTTPVNILGSTKQIAAGAYHTCALFWNGKVRCWGRGAEGQLGYGNTNDIGDNESPSSVGYVDVGGTVTQIVAGNVHTCALLDTGKVRCWGYGASGQLGYGNANAIGDNEMPSSAGDVNVGGTVTQIAAGYNHTCALLDTGKIRCWGDASSGQLGYGNTTTIGDNESPSSVGYVNVGGTATHLAAGYNHTCALLDTGKIRCWGAGSYGQLGYGNTATIGDNELPSSVGYVNIGGTATQITGGQFHTCALLDTGKVRCWGNGIAGQLGYGSTSNVGDGVGPSIIDVGDINVGDTVMQITAGQNHTCALLATGSIRCWGNGQYGRLGYANTNNIGDSFGETPAAIGDVNVGGTLTHIMAGYEHTCAVVDNRGIRCWGYGFYGRLGYGNTNDIGDNETPASAGDVPAF